MRAQDFLKTPHPHDARFGLGVVEDGDLAGLSRNGFDDGLGCLPTPFQVVGGNVANDQFLRLRVGAAGIGCEHGNPRIVSFLDGRSDRHGIARAQDNRGRFLDDEVFDLVVLFGRVHLGANHDRFHPLFLRFGGDRITDRLEERIGQVHDRNADKPLGSAPLASFL